MMDKISYIKGWNDAQAAIKESADKIEIAGQHYYVVIAPVLDKTVVEIVAGALND